MFDQIFYFYFFWGGGGCRESKSHTLTKLSHPAEFVFRYNLSLYMNRMWRGTIEK